MERKKIVLITTLSFFFLACIGLGIYFFLRKIDANPVLDKYSDLMAWCENTKSDNNINITCDALLTTISIPEEDRSCFNIQIITKAHELKDFSVCESKDTITYTNDILNYKILMPIQIALSYKKSDFINKFALEAISITPASQELIKTIINQDIETLAERDLSTTVIKNDTDSCPDASNLPDFVEDPIKTRYSEFMNQSTTAIDQNDLVSAYDLDSEDSTILFACDQSDSANCQISATFKAKVSQIIKSLNSGTPQWGNSQSKNIPQLKQISMLYDNVDAILPRYSPYAGAGSNLDITTIKASILGTFLAESNNLDEDTYCGLGHLLTRLDIPDNQYLNQIRENIMSNIGQSSSAICMQILEKEVFDIDGLYLKYSLSQNEDNALYVYEKCVNLSEYTKTK